MQSVNGDRASHHQFDHDVEPPPPFPPWPFSCVFCKKGFKGTKTLYNHLQKDLCPHKCLLFGLSPPAHVSAWVCGACMAAPDQPFTTEDKLLDHVAHDHTGCHSWDFSIAMTNCLRTPQLQAIYHSKLEEQYVTSLIWVPSDQTLAIFRNLLVMSNDTADFEALVDEALSAATEAKVTWVYAPVPSISNAEDFIFTSIDDFDHSEKDSA